MGWSRKAPSSRSIASAEIISGDGRGTCVLTVDGLPDVTDSTLELMKLREVHGVRELVDGEQFLSGSRRWSQMGAETGTAGANRNED